MLITALIPLSLANTTDSGAELDVSFLSGMQFPSPSFKVKNIGDVTVHNIALTDTIVVGDVLYNNRERKIADSLLPDESSFKPLNSLLIGFGVFNITITVTCDEGIFSSDLTHGFIIGPFSLIP